jgi:hypothetical protein
LKSVPTLNKQLEHLKTVGIFLLVGLIAGLVYVFSIPPWQHYDEPGHFEYAWLIANKPGIPTYLSYDQGMRREVAASMIEHGFFRDLAYRPNLLSVYEPIWIGIEQTNDPPTYYWLAAIPLRVFQYTDITFQMYLSRLVSLGLFLITIAAAYGITTELTPEKHRLRWMVPLTLALLPGTLDIMTSINNDVGATAIFSLYLWVSIGLIKRGFNWMRFLSLLVLGVLCFFTKNTVAIAAPLTILPIIFSLLREGKRRYAWGLITALTVIGAFLLFEWSEAAGWYRVSHHTEATRIRHAEAVIGNHVLEHTLEESHRSQIFQIIPFSKLEPLKGAELTLGAWIWADHPVMVQFPYVFYGGRLNSQMIELSTEPTFFAQSFTLPNETNRSQIILSPESPNSESPVTIFYDGLTLAQGKRPLDQPPIPESASGATGNWGDDHYTNIIRNGTAHAGWLRIRPQVENFIDDFFPDRPSLILASFIDWEGAGWYYRGTAHNLFHTFWGKFGWANVALEGSKPYRPLLVFTVLAGFGMIYTAIENRKFIPWDIVLFLAFILIFLWGSTLVRGISSISGAIFIPSARYASPAIIPTLLLLCTGWAAYLSQIEQRFKIHPLVLPGLYLTLFLILNVFAVSSIIRFYS